MKSIYEVDPNFAVERDINKPDVVFYNCLNEPFQVCGLLYEGEKFRRMPENVARSVNDGVLWLHTNTAGGRVRFRTNSPYVAIAAKMDGIGKMPHFALTGSAGFDLYTDDGHTRRYAGTFEPPFDLENGYKSVVELGSETMKDVTIHFPLYSNVVSLLIGVKDGAVIEAPTPYRNLKPIVYYGSSITQGGCASRPGSAYPNVISMKQNVDHINLGFSGSARGEDTMSDYIRNLEMSVFVYDYDYNAPSAEHLELTHEKLFLAFREKHSDVPVIMMSRPSIYLNEEEQRRLQIIRTTYENAIARGDRNVYFISGQELMADTDNNGTVDGCHPTDYGFYAMAKAVGEQIRQILEK